MTRWRDAAAWAGGGCAFAFGVFQVAGQVVLPPLAQMPDRDAAAAVFALPAAVAAACLGFRHGYRRVASNDDGRPEGTEP